MNKPSLSVESDVSTNRFSHSDGPKSSGSRSGLRLGRLALKELRETLRDRRTIITLIAMPLLVYPILSLVFRTFLFSSIVSLPTNKPLEFSIVLDTEIGDEQVQFLLNSVYQLTRDKFEGANEQANSQLSEDENDSESLANELFEQELQFADFFDHFKELSETDPDLNTLLEGCLLYTSPSPRDRQKSRMPSSA